MQQVLLILNLSPDMEEDMVDWLLMQDEIDGFTSMMVYGHGAHAKNMSLDEQVMGRQKRVQFMVHGEQSQMQALLAAAQQTWPDSDLRYVLMPVMQAG